MVCHSFCIRALSPAQLQDRFTLFPHLTAAVWKQGPAFPYMYCRFQKHWKVTAEGALLHILTDVFLPCAMPPEASSFWQSSQCSLQPRSRQLCLHSHRCQLLFQEAPTTTLSVLFPAICHHKAVPNTGQQ